MNPTRMMIEHRRRILLRLLLREKESTSRPSLFTQLVPFLFGIARVREAHLLAIYGNRHIIVIETCAVCLTYPWWCHNPHSCELVYMAIAT